MSALYEIDRNLYELLENDMVVDEETGEIIFEESDIDNLLLSRDQKLENTACYIKNLMSDIDQIKTEEKALKERRQTKEKKVERLKSYLANSMLLFGDKKFETPRVALSFRKSKQVEIAEDANIPQEYMTIKVEKNPNKTKLKDAILKQGLLIDGVQVVEKENLQLK